MRDFKILVRFPNIFIFILFYFIVYLGCTEVLRWRKTTRAVAKWEVGS